MRTRHISTAFMLALTGMLITPVAQAATCDGLTATIVGTNGADNITGTSGQDVISALGGNDTVHSGNAWDRVCGDGGNDSSLEDMWRYAIDAAAMDWMGSGDHDNGGHREYPWWITQKTTDAYHLPGVFDSMFTYERSVSYPEGHRNVVFDKRGRQRLR